MNYRSIRAFHRILLQPKSILFSGVKNGDATIKRYYKYSYRHLFQLSAKSQINIQQRRTETSSSKMDESERNDKMAFINAEIQKHRVFIFSKSWCPFCAKAKELLAQADIEFGFFELDLVDDGDLIQNKLLEKTGQKTVPSIFINQEHIGGFSNLNALAQNGTLKDIVAGISFDYDLIVIGGGSGGIAAVNEARKYSKKVAICDFVEPSPQGTTWGIGGTCVNVGCIPKKLMHRASLLEHDLKDAPYFGWEGQTGFTHNWNTLVENVGNYIKSLNFGYRKEFRKNEIQVMNAFAEFVDNHNVKITEKNGKTQIINSKMFLIATGLRPFYPPIPGAKEFGITSDDLFSLQTAPGKTLVIGASYIALECAGFLQTMGQPCTVMVRSILLRGFDQEIAQKIEENMAERGIKFLKRCIPLKVTKGQNGLTVEGVYEDGKTYSDTFQTVMFATGREAPTHKLGLNNAGIAISPKNKKIIVNDKDQTSVPNIFAVGDVADINLELTPVAIKAGRLLAMRMFGAGSDLMDYTNVPTTVFTPLEYGCVGETEEAAREKYGDQVEVFHNIYKPLEGVLVDRHEKQCYAKLVCKKEGKEWKVIGLHILGPNAGEVTQGYALAVKLGATKKQFDSLVGIHPTNAEVFTTMSVAKSSGKALVQTGC